MRLAILSPLTWRTPPQHYGPREKLAALLCEGLVSRGIDVTLFASGGSKASGSLTAVCPTACAEMPSSNPTLWEALHVAHLSEQAVQFDLIHNHGDFLPLMYSRFLHTPMVTTLYDAPPPPVSAACFQEAARHYYVAPSTASQRPEVTYTATIHPGVDLSTLPFCETPGEYLVYCGRIAPAAEVTTAVDIAQQYGMPLRLVGPITDQAYYETQIAPLLVPGRVDYLGAVTLEVCYTLLANAYALLQPSRTAKPFSLSAIEAMACGTPVVALAAGAMPEIVRDGETGFLVAHAADAATKLRHVAALDRQRCWQWVAERFSLERMVSAYVEVYADILQREKPRAHHASPPWGRWEVLLDEPYYKVKRITVLPGQRLSYQKHFRREEHWTIVQGQALVTLDGRDFPQQAGATIHVPQETAHRIANPGPEPLVFIEVQCGTYFGEDDIVRLQDDYGRNST
jgi:mannose-6-phosphate isomerase-like protein (cupin superfamily)/glycosyltransferase involved in cell wall biosynthesis